MKWLIQPIKNEYQQINEIVNLLNMAGVAFEFVIPKNEKILYLNNEVFHFEKNEQYFVLGSYALTRIAAQLNSKSVFSLQNFDFNSWFDIFGKENFVNHDVQISLLKDVEWIFDKMFIRPFHDNKAFNGVYKKAEIDDLDNVSVIASSIKKIDKEFRFFFINGEMVTCSLYKVNGQFSTYLQIDEKAIEFAQEMSKKFDFPGYSMDVAAIEDSYKIMELNCLNASGFYNINLYKLVNAVLDYYENDQKLYKKYIK